MAILGTLILPLVVMVAILEPQHAAIASSTLGLCNIGTLIFAPAWGSLADRFVMIANPTVTLPW